MKAPMKWICLTALVAGLGAPGIRSFAQDQGDRPPRDNPQDVRPRQEGGGAGFRGGRNGDGPPGFRPMRPDAEGRPFRLPGAPIEQMRNYLDMVEQYARVARDPASAGVAAVVATVDVMRAKGPQAVIDHFNKILPDVKNEAVARAINLQLVDLYKASNQPDKALDILRKMMTDAPAGAQPAPVRGTLRPVRERQER